MTRTTSIFGGRWKQEKLSFLYAIMTSLEMQWTNITRRKKQIISCYATKFLLWSWTSLINSSNSCWKVGYSILLQDCYFFYSTLIKYLSVILKHFCACEISLFRMLNQPKYQFCKINIQCKERCSFLPLCLSYPSMLYNAWKREDG